MSKKIKSLYLNKNNIVKKKFYLEIFYYLNVIMHLIIINLLMKNLKIKFLNKSSDKIIFNNINSNNNIEYINSEEILYFSFNQDNR